MSEGGWRGQRKGKHTRSRLFSLIHHLGLVESTGPHSGSRGEIHLPLDKATNCSARSVRALLRKKVMDVRSTTDDEGRAACSGDDRHATQANELDHRDRWMVVTRQLVDDKEPVTNWRRDQKCPISTVACTFEYRSPR